MEVTTRVAPIPGDFERPLTLEIMTDPASRHLFQDAERFGETYEWVCCLPYDAWLPKEDPRRRQVALVLQDAIALEVIANMRAHGMDIDLTLAGIHSNQFLHDAHDTV